jgi:hypothetical protein
MKLTPSRLLTVCIAAVVVACSSATAPSDLLLDGTWTTGLLLNGLALGLDLTWTPTLVRGKGTYDTFDVPAQCGNETITGSGTLKLIALRTSATKLSGSLAFGTADFHYDGTLAHGTLQGSKISSDGTACPLSLLRGLIP